MTATPPLWFSQQPGNLGIDGRIGAGTFWGLRQFPSYARQAAISRLLDGNDSGAAPDRTATVFFKQQTGFRNQLQRWRPQTLTRARSELIQAEIDCKSTGMPDDAVCERALMRLAAMAGARIPR